MSTLRPNRLMFGGIISTMPLTSFSLKFIDIMIGVVLGLGFQWWTELEIGWQYFAFIFAYIDIIDYWIDYAPSLRKFPPKREIDIVLDVAIMFSLFLYIYATQKSIVYFLSAFVLLRALDAIWLMRAKHEYPHHEEKTFMLTWLRFNIIEVVFVGLLVLCALFYAIAPGILLGLCVAFWLFMRILASRMYKRVHFL